jgi:diadenosine tetraphosphate (Ap4A) HIT family hydrolase
VNIDTLEKAQEEGRAPWSDIEINTREFIVYRDKFPVTEGHLLIVPRQSDQDSLQKCFKFAVEMGNQNVASDKTTISGYNIGLNIGESAGQTCMYPHVHLIFRRDGDTEEPKGGVRGVIPSKQTY